MLDARIIARLRAADQIYKLISAIVAPVAILTALVWSLVFLINLMVEGLRLISAAWQEASALVAGMPVLHFFFLLALACVALVLAARLVRAALKGVVHV